jgi:hypothetical protein
MNPIIQANIFFFITSVAVVLISLLVIVLLIYLVLVLKDFRGVSKKVKQETDLIAMDINDARTHIREKGAAMSSLFDFFKDLAGKPKSHTKKKQS